MSWATHAKEALRRGETVRVRPHGNSMRGKISDGDLVTLVPCDPASLQVGDIVLVHLHGADYLHLIKAIQGDRYLIGNNRGRINGWAGKQAIYGKAAQIE